MIAASIVAAAGVLLVDLALPRPVAIGFAYILVVLAFWRSRSAAVIGAAAVAATILAILGHILSAAGGEPWIDLTNRGLAVLVIVAMAAVLIRERLVASTHAVVIGELDHRLRNNLSAVLSIADQTVAHSQSLAEFTPAFAGRLRAMAIAHEMLSRQGWLGADLQSIVERVLEPFHRGHPDRFTLTGPAIRLTAAVAPSICMVLQELATNATRYGALSTFDGCVSVEWAREITDGRAAQLRLTWSETGGPKVTRPSRCGFGSTLIERLIAYQTQGHATLDFDEGGVRCDVVLPASGFE